mgnify:CR=1 FL=1
MAATKALTKLRRAACDPRLVAPETGLVGVAYILYLAYKQWTSSGSSAATMTRRAATMSGRSLARPRTNSGVPTTSPYSVKLRSPVEPTTASDGPLVLLISLSVEIP